MRMVILVLEGVGVQSTALFSLILKSRKTSSFWQSVPTLPCEIFCISDDETAAMSFLVSSNCNN